MSNTITRREDRRRQQDGWLSATEKGLKSRDIAQTLGESIRTIQWGIAAAKRRRDRMPSLPKLHPIFGPKGWEPDIERARVKDGKPTCRLCGSVAAHKRHPGESNIVASSIVCAACHAVSPSNQRKIDMALNRQEVADSARELNYRETAPKKLKKRAKGV